MEGLRNKRALQQLFSTLVSLVRRFPKKGWIWGVGKEVGMFILYSHGNREGNARGQRDKLVPAVLLAKKPSSEGK